MTRPRAWTAVVLIAAAVALASCAKVSSSDELAGPAKLAPVAGAENLQQVTLTQQAVKRLGLEMTAISQEGQETVIPYAAVVYDAEGRTWAYTSPKSLTFVRAPITVTRIVGDRAFLSAGPGPGTKVVTVGTAELFGTEAGIGY